MTGAGRLDGRLRRAEHLLEGPMVLLAFAWIGLMIMEFAGVRSAWLETAGNVIWAVFVIDFVLRLALADRKARFLRKNGLTLVSIVLPALRIFRVAIPTTCSARMQAGSPAR